jgi:DNA transformation protein and related proteins
VALSADFLAYVLEQLGRIEGLSYRRMFGGAGLYSDADFFALLFADTLYLRVDDANRAQFTARGMQAFRPYADRPQLSMSYYQAPAEVLEDAAQLARWAMQSVAAARQAAASRAVRPARARQRRASARPAAAAKRRP